MLLPVKVEILGWSFMYSSLSHIIQLCLLTLPIDIGYEIRKKSFDAGTSVNVLIRRAKKACPERPNRHVSSNLPKLEIVEARSLVTRAVDEMGYEFSTFD
jgi:hypothetical protein